MVNNVLDRSEKRMASTESRRRPPRLTPGKFGLPDIKSIPELTVSLSALCFASHDPALFGLLPSGGSYPYARLTMWILRGELLGFALFIGGLFLTVAVGIVSAIVKG